MTDDEVTSITLRLPKSLRERLEAQAKREERTLSQCVRFHLSARLDGTGGTKPRRPKSAA
jgi:predicted DNA-binding protein